MNTNFIRRLLAVLMILSMIIFVVSGCAGGLNETGTTTTAGTTTTTATGTTTSNTSPAGSVTKTGTVAVYITDAPPDQEITAVVVAVSGLRIHLAEAEQEQEQSGTGNQTQEQEQEQQSGDGGEWIDIPISGNMTEFDLLQYRDVQAFFGGANVTAGKYTQVRLVVESANVTTADNQTRQATVNSGEIKIVRPFTIVEGETTELLLDFDARKSVNFTGNGKVMIKPVIKLSIDARHQGQPADEDSGDDEETNQNSYTFNVSCDEFQAQNVITGNITIPLGEQLTVCLCSNASTGYQWNEEAVFSVNGTIVQTGHEYIEPGSQGNGQGQGQGQVGAAGMEQWTFTTQAAGETVLYFEYGQPWEGGEKATWTLELTVIVE